MADLDVKPKSGTPWWLWLLLLLILLGLGYYFLRGRNAGLGNGSADTTATTTDSTTTVNTATSTANWDSVDFDAPKAAYGEVSDTGIVVRGNDKYGIYSLGENLLFATGQTQLQANASKSLQQIAASLKKRFDNAEIGVYGRADSKGDAATNKEIAAKRAEAVRNWLVSEGKIDESKITVRSFGETKPLSSNATPQGRQQNRSVEIVALRNGSSASAQ
jgi:outer membrane protein OmpA-like peptidoglycan-associated protein